MNINIYIYTHRYAYIYIYRYTYIIYIYRYTYIYIHIYILLDEFLNNDMVVVHDHGCPLEDSCPKVIAPMLLMSDRRPALLYKVFGHS